MAGNGQHNGSVDPELGAGSGGCVVLGLGNPILSDDAVGLRIAAELKRRLAQAPLAGVTVLESTRAGFELIDMLTGFDYAVIVDCLDVPGGEPGALRILDAASFAGSARLNCAHEINLTTAFRLAARLGVPMPRQVEVYGVEAGDARTISEEMTPLVAAAVLPVAELLHRRLREISRALALPPDAATGSRVEPVVARAFYPPGD